MMGRRVAVGLLLLAYPATRLMADETLADLRWERDAIATRLDRIDPHRADAAQFRTQLAHLNARIARMLPGTK